MDWVNNFYSSCLNFQTWPNNCITQSVLYVKVILNFEEKIKCSCKVQSWLEWKLKSPAKYRGFFRVLLIVPLPKNVGWKLTNSQFVELTQNCFSFILGLSTTPVMNFREMFDLGQSLYLKRCGYCTVLFLGSSFTLQLKWFQSSLLPKGATFLFHVFIVYAQDESVHLADLVGSPT